MQLNRSHRKFNLAMEAVCSLPRWPLMVPMDKLAEDFGFRKHAPLISVLNDAKDAGFKVETHNNQSRGNSRMVCISLEGWDNAVAKSLAYWREVNENPAVSESK